MKLILLSSHSCSAEIAAEATSIIEKRLSCGARRRGRERIVLIPQAELLTLFHGIEVEDGLKLGLAARQEHDAWDRGGHTPLEQLQGVICHLQRHFHISASSNTLVAKQRQVLFFMTRLEPTFHAPDQMHGAFLAHKRRSSDT